MTGKQPKTLTDLERAEARLRKAQVDPGAALIGVFTVREGQIHRAEYFFDHDKALEAAVESAAHCACGRSRALLQRSLARS
jgi:hypothetical protein